VNKLNADNYREGRGYVEKRCPGCGEWKLATPAAFGKGGNKYGIGHKCKICRGRDYMAESLGLYRNDRPDRFAEKWAGSKWVAVEIDEQRKIAARARFVCRSEGYDWIEDDVAQHALIEAHRGGKPDVKNILYSFLREEFGRVGTERNEFETMSRLCVEDVLELEMAG
jgi:hypothetical protein